MMMDLIATGMGMVVKTRKWRMKTEKMKRAMANKKTKI